MSVIIPFGKSGMPLHADLGRAEVLESRVGELKAADTEDGLVLAAMASPIDSPRLRELAAGKKTCTIIISDHTRPVPSKHIIPVMLSELREGSPGIDVTLLVATGFHRPTGKEELVDKLGREIVEREKIVIHNSRDASGNVQIGTLPSGAACVIDKVAAQADLLVAEGFIEPHFFAGFSGGRKSILPGIASRTTVLANHCSEFIADLHSRTGILEGNPIHKDMVWAAKEAKLAFILNVVINEKKEAIYAVAGDFEAAHIAGCEFLSSLCKVDAKPADIVISTNGGYPLDQNIYQAVKGMTAAEATVKKGGVIIMLAKSNDGHGGEGFYHQLADEPDINKTLKLFLSRDRNETEPDQWQTQIFIRILQKAAVIYISDASDELVKDLHMIPAHSLDEAMEKAEAMVGSKEASVTAIPDGVSVMVIE